ncbi:MAG TPA: DNA-formamidopyrimidine glycosylase family protein, partial [Pilimelia sp.]|nr:DNA-formamidopyrimidine glycosylase family protein [Pilimelia sp.]
IHRAARALAAAVRGELVTAARFHPRTGIQAAVVTGRTVREVEPRGKHLLVWLGRDGREDVALHTHLRMSGSWHIYERGHAYEQGRAWSRPGPQATAVLETARWAAVCFNAPVCELLTAGQVARHPALAGLGPDLAATAPDVAEVRRRMDAQGSRPLLDVLLDQRVFAGVGNVYKSELCWLHRVHPLTPVGRLDGAVRDALIADAAPVHVQPARRTAWCPRCQPAP